MSTNLFSKMFQPGYLRGKVVRVFQERLGIEIKGMDTFQRPGKRITERKVGLQLAEGLAACLMGYVRQTSMQTVAASNSTSVFCELELNAYRNSDTADFNSVLNTISGTKHICGANFGEKKIFTGIASTSSTASSTNTGKTELSVFISALLSAVVAYRLGDAEAAPFLSTYQGLLGDLKALNALPLSSLSSPPQMAPPLIDQLSTNLKIVTDSAYEWLAYSGESERAGAPRTVNNWDVELLSLSALPDYVQLLDFAAMLTDADKFRDFMSTKQFPNETGAGVQANAPAQVPANQPPPVAAAPPPAPNPSTTTGNATTGTGSRRPRSAAQTAPAVSNIPQKPPRPNLPPYMLGIQESTRIRMPRGGSYSVLLKGPAGTGKTWAVFNSDQMPTNRIGVSSEVDASLLLGEFNRDDDGNWKPFLGSVARVARTSMLEAILVQFKRGKRLDWKEYEKYSHPLVKTLKILQSDPADKDALRELDALAMPTAPKSWEVVHNAYFDLEAPSVGPVRRLFLDEIWDSAGNKEVTTVLKFLMEDERRVILSRAGAGWSDLFAYNVHLVAAGNPDESLSTGIGLSRAIRSRFGFTYGVGYCNESDEIARTLSGAATRVKPIAKPVGFELSSSTYDPPLIPELNPSRQIAETAVAFASWTRTQFRSGALGELLDPRGVDQIAYTAAYINQTYDVSLKDAFLAAVETVADRLCEMDDLGLPLERQRVTVIQKAAEVGARL